MGLSCFSKFFKIKFFLIFGLFSITSCSSAKQKQVFPLPIPEEDCGKLLDITDVVYSDVAFMICIDECLNLPETEYLSLDSECTVPPIFYCEKRAIAFNLSAVEDYNDCINAEKIVK